MDNFSKYLTYSEEDLKWKLVCTNAGSTKIQSGIVYPPNMNNHPQVYRSVATGRTLREYSLIYITKGRGKFYSQGQEYTVIPGTIIILFPGIKHAYQPDIETGWDEYWVGFKGEYIDSLSDEGIIKSLKPIYYIGLHNIILSHFQSIFDRINKQKPCYQMRTATNIMMLLADIISYDRNIEQSNHIDDLVEKIKFLFEQNIYRSLELEEIAEQLRLSSSYLCEVFKSYTGMTPYQYFLHLKVNKAKEFLEIGELSIKEIAYKLAFEDQYYFSRLFKKKTGVPPSKWTIYHYDNFSK
ncbi:MAG: hypothetical protein B6241_02220 [Spirochaetaceae bacterium 4572_59]|nr:MAG: hypothetical protein B6241_02220 [Spirochaetaceae bacterium 4572_59]